MKLDLLYKATDKFLDQMLRKKLGMDYELSIDEKMTEVGDIPMFSLHVLVDPEKYHWGGDSYNPRYQHFIDYIEDYLDKIMKYIGLSSDNFSNIITKFDSSKIKKYYKRVIPEIPRVWKIFQERMSSKTKVPDLKSIKLLKRENGDYDLKLHLDRDNLSDDEFREMIDSTFQMFFVVFGDHGIPMDTNYVEFV